MTRLSNAGGYNIMSRLSTRKYGIAVDSYFLDYEDYYNRTHSNGSFSEDGMAYTIVDKKTPRPWIHMLYNDRFASEITNTGFGHTVYGTFYNRVTRYHDPELYLLREPKERRLLELVDCDNDYSFNLFDCENMQCVITPGCIEFSGEENQIKFSVKVFVPINDVCECWMIKLEDISGKERKLTLKATQVWSFHVYLGGIGTKEPSKNTITQYDENAIYAIADDVGHPFYCMYGGFGITECTDKLAVKDCEKTLITPKRLEPQYADFNYTVATVSTNIVLQSYASVKRVVSSAASTDEKEVKDTISKFQSVDTAEKEIQKAHDYWEKQLEFNTCEIPDKNLERFLNVWLKYQLGVTYRYNRSTHNGGYRDVLQDSWGTMLINPEYGKERFLEALTYCYYDGHSMRAYDSYVKNDGDKDVFIDCPLWAPNTALQYVNETGNVGILNMKLPYYDNDTEETVEEHLWKMCEFAYNSRGENGLLKMLDGDWLDGLSGINHGGVATSAWATMQAFWAQNQLAKIEDILGNTEKATLLRQRSAEYKEIVNRVAWDGNWYIYGFKGDGEPVGSSKCLEGKIYLNPQTWAIFTGIEDDPQRIQKMYLSIHTYLTTIFGPLLLYPPYVNDTTCGRLSGQMPGSFANGAVYLHAGTFKVYADFASGKYDEAYDTMMRLMPNHIDNPDMHRTSEPWVIGNVHFGPDSERFGMNLFTWFTATPAWLIHAGFEQLLGVQAEYDGLHINPKVPDDWNEYCVKKLYRGKEFKLSFRRGEEKGIYANGVRVGRDIIPADTMLEEYEIVY